MDRSRTPTGAPSAADDPSLERGRVLDDLCALLEREAERFGGVADGDSLARLERLAEAVRGHLLALRVLHEAGSRGRPGGSRARAPAPPAHRASSPPEGPPPGEASPPPRAESPPPETEPRPERAPSRSAEPPARAAAPARSPPEAPPAPSAAAEGAGANARREPPGDREGADGKAPERFPPFRDQRTGLHSREGFDAIASGELKRCRRHDRVFSLLMLQLPARREEPLRRAALTLRRNLRESDLAGRHVERTLAVALPETSVEQARIVSQRILTALEEAGTWDEEGRIGIATHPVDGETLLTLLDTARGQLALPARAVLYPSGPGV